MHLTLNTGTIVDDRADESEFILVEWLVDFLAKNLGIILVPWHTVVLITSEGWFSLWSLGGLGPLDWDSEQTGRGVLPADSCREPAALSRVSGDSVSGLGEVAPHPWLLASLYGTLWDSVGPSAGAALDFAGLVARERLLIGGGFWSGIGKFL